MQLQAAGAGLPTMGGLPPALAAAAGTKRLLRDWQRLKRESKRVVA